MSKIIKEQLVLEMTSLFCSYGNESSAILAQGPATN